MTERRLPPSTDQPRAARSLALVLGDMVFAFAQRSLWETQFPHDLQRRLGTLQPCCLVATGCGEAADIVHGLREVSEVSPHEIEQMYLLKTTRYTIECPLAMAAVLTGAGAPELAVLADSSRPVGLAFQIQNDLQEFARCQRLDIGALSDLLEGKKTLLLPVTFSRLDASDRTSSQKCYLSVGSRPTPLPRHAAPWRTVAWLANSPHG